MKKALLSILLSLVILFTGAIVIGSSFEKEVVTDKTTATVEYTATEETAAQAGWIKEIKVSDGTEIKVPAVLYEAGEVITEAVGVEGEEGYVPAVIATGTEEKVPAVLYTEGEQIITLYAEGDVIAVDTTYYVVEQVDITTPYKTVMFTKLGLGKLFAKDGWTHGLQMIAFALFALSTFFLAIVLKTKFKKGERKQRQRKHRHIKSDFFEEPQKRDRVKF
jgi:hypothetical protein